MYRPSTKNSSLRALAFAFMYASFASILHAHEPDSVAPANTDVEAMQQAEKQENNAIRANFAAGIAFGILFLVAFAYDAVVSLLGVAIVTISFSMSHKKWFALLLIPASCLFCTLTLSSTIRGWTAQLNQGLKSQGVQFVTPVATVQPDVLVRIQNELRNKEITALTLEELETGRVTTVAGAREFSLETDALVYLQRNWWQVCQYNDQSICVVTNDALIEYGRRQNMAYLQE